MCKSLFPTIVLFAAVSLPVSARELTGRFAMSASGASAEEDDYGYVSAEEDSPSTDEQSLRLMLNEADDVSEWSVHLVIDRQRQDGYGALPVQPAGIFRYDELGHDWQETSTATSETRSGYQFDRLFYKRKFSRSDLAVGRQPIDWSMSHIWQPMNVFDAFHPTAIDTEFKPGIDSVVYNHYLSPFRSLTAAYVLADRDDDDLESSYALFYRGGVGERSGMTLSAGSIQGNRMLGGAFVSAIGNFPYRIEGRRYHLDYKDRDSLFWIAGIDYQFDNGALVTLEYYDNDNAAESESNIFSVVTDPAYGYGMQQQFSRQGLGVSIQNDLTPLLHGSWTVLGSTLDDDAGDTAHSILHQINLTYSVSNESSLLVSFLTANGKGFDGWGVPQSEYGHVPQSVTVRYWFYF